MRLLATLLLGPLIGLGVWMLVVGWFMAGIGIRAIEGVGRRAKPCDRM